MSTSTVPPEVVAEAKRLLRSPIPAGQRLREKIIEKILMGCGLLSIAITIGIAAVLIFGAFEFFTHDEHVEYNRVEIKTPEGKVEQREVYDWMTGEDIWNRIVYFFTGSQWTANIAPHHYGILPLLVGTMMVALLASLLAMPSSSQSRWAWPSIEMPGRSGFLKSCFSRWVRVSRAKNSALLRVWW